MFASFASYYYFEGSSLFFYCRWRLWVILIFYCSNERCLSSIELKPASLRSLSGHDVNRALFTTISTLTLYNQLICEPRSSNAAESIESISIEAAAKFIQENCTIFLNAAHETGRVVYRGERSTRIENGQSVLRSPAYDLLETGTYSDFPDVAADYFQSLDRFLMQQGQQQIRPGIGHIAVADLIKASQWGVVESVWPLDVGLHYSWLRGGPFWRSKWSRVQNSDRPPFFWRSPTLLKNFLDEELVVDTQLPNALNRGAEVLFSNSANGSYLSVPFALESKLFKLLSIEPFTTTSVIKVSTKAMQLDDEVKQPARNRYIRY
jgi:hypothetical protein